MVTSTFPRPLLQRKTWINLDGFWEFSSRTEVEAEPGSVQFEKKIIVPFPPESEASGLHDQNYHPVVWYRKELKFDPGESCWLLHFGAVDYYARVWINGHFVAEHEGGHCPFSVDITGFAKTSGNLEITVCAQDDPLEIDLPRGKQDWELKPHRIWYPRTTGIWQTVWLEQVPETRIAGLAWTPNLERWEIGVEVDLHGKVTNRHSIRIRLTADSKLLAEDRYTITGKTLRRSIRLEDGGLYHIRSKLLWSPERPRLIQASIELMDGEEILDAVQSYTAMRSVSVDEQQFLLNGRPYHLRMVLDQGYWPDTLMSATDYQLKRDVELTKLLGFNGARKHQKIENPRFLYWCDVLGLLIWEEMPSAYAYSPKAVRRFTSEWIDVIMRDRSHPCIAAWVPFNESWGVPDLPENQTTRDYVRAGYHLTRALDPTRPVIGNDGWEHVETDIITIHDYTDNPADILRRYKSIAAANETVLYDRPNNHVLGVDGFDPAGLPVMLTEFGGIAFTRNVREGWGYSRVFDEQSFLAEYKALLAAVHGCGGLSGFCYTQLTDTFQEKNGLLNADRTFKADHVALARATIGNFYYDE
ncbi:MAG: glycoside hydrolase family 2 [Verrucomicrobia bacterium]|nr:glycoside hydrolase family 2 [Verrucomicrobiota bacterium]